MSDIKVLQFTSQETADYRERKYQEFLRYYFKTTLGMNDIFKLLDLPKMGAVSKYIRRRMKSEGYNSLVRYWSIKKGEWL